MQNSGPEYLDEERLHCWNKGQEKEYLKKSIISYKVSLLSTYIVMDFVCECVFVFVCVWGEVFAKTVYTPTWHKKGANLSAFPLELTYWSICKCLVQRCILSLGLISPEEMVYTPLLGRCTLFYSTQWNQCSLLSTSLSLPLYFSNTVFLFTLYHLMRCFLVKDGDRPGKLG